MLERTFDAAWFNALCNRPEVRPWLAPGVYPLDVSAAITNPANYALRTEHGGFILEAKGAGFYSVHTQFAAEGRGSHAIAAMQAGLDFMFTRTDCMRIFSHCPDNNRSALALAEKGGARPWFRNEVEPMLGPGQVVSWDIMDWLTKTDELAGDGEAFHDLIERAKTLTGAELPDHPPDRVHDRVVGGVSRMCQRGQPAKGALCYNLWAAAAYYQPIRPISLDPPIMDVGEGFVVAIGENGMEARLCQ